MAGEGGGDAVTRHLADMALRGRAAGTIYQRRRILARLAAWLQCYREADALRPERTGSVVQQDDQQAQDAAATSDGNVRWSVCGVENRDSPPLPVLLTATAGELLAWRTALTVEPPSVRTTVAHVRTFYAWLALEGHRPDNPAARIPVPKRERSLPRPIGEDDLMAALASAPPRVRPWLVLAGWCGLRAREIAWLRRDAILDRAARPLIVVSAMSAKGGRMRVVAMPPFAVAELRPVLPGSGWAFPRADGRAGPNTPGTVSALSAEAIRRSGTDATLHQLRHRYATMMYELSGHDLRMVQEALGHQNLATTAVYTMLVPSAAADAAALLPVPGGRRLRAVGG